MTTRHWDSNFLTTQLQHQGPYFWANRLSILYKTSWATADSAPGKEPQPRDSDDFKVWGCPLCLRPEGCQAVSVRYFFSRKIYKAESFWRILVFQWRSDALVSVIFFGRGEERFFINSQLPIRSFDQKVLFLCSYLPFRCRKLLKCCRQLFRLKYKYNICSL